MGQDSQILQSRRLIGVLLQDLSVESFRLGQTARPVQGHGLLQDAWVRKCTLRELCLFLLFFNPGGSFNLFVYLRHFKNYEPTEMELQDISADRSIVSRKTGQENPKNKTEIGKEQGDKLMSCRPAWSLTSSAKLHLVARLAIIRNAECCCAVMAGPARFTALHICHGSLVRSALCLEQVRVATVTTAKSLNMG
jgi:hypothetical protein